jgi:hypothetical protein
MWTESNSFKVLRPLPFKKIHEDYILLDSKNAKAHELNVVAFSIWQNLQNDTTYTNLLSALQVEFEVDQISLKNDLKMFLDDLIERELISITNG